MLPNLDVGAEAGAPAGCSALSESAMRRRTSSTYSTFTFTRWPTFTTSAGSFTKRLASSLT